MGSSIWSLITKKSDVIYEQTLNDFLLMSFFIHQGVVLTRSSVPRNCLSNNYPRLLSRCQFHQHFYVQIFCTNVVSAAFTMYMQLEKAAKMLRCYEKFVRKTLMKLTQDRWNGGKLPESGEGHRGQAVATGHLPKEDAAAEAEAEHRTGGRRCGCSGIHLVQWCSQGRRKGAVASPSILCFEPDVMGFFYYFHKNVPSIELHMVKMSNSNLQTKHLATPLKIKLKAR